jgi:hypothetical protein
MLPARASQLFSASAAACSADPRHKSPNEVLPPSGPLFVCLPPAPTAKQTQAFSFFALSGIPRKREERESGERKMALSFVFISQPQRKTRGIKEERACVSNARGEARVEAESSHVLWGPHARSKQQRVGSIKE